MRIHIWHGANETTELLMTPEQDCSACPPPQTGGAWVYHSVTTRQKVDTEPLPGAVSWEEINACFSFTGHWTGSGELPETP